MKVKTLSLAIAVAASGSIVSTALAENLVLEEITVTARKRAESLQDTPVAVTAFSSDQLNKMGVVDFEGLQKSNPNVSIIPARGASVVASQVAIRGNVQSSSLITVDESVGVYVDDVLNARSYGVGGILVDVESVQTLKGPQGTLFGRNTTGGAMLVKTVDPSLEGLSGKVKLGVAERGSEDYFAAVNIPLSDKVAVRLVGARSNSDGYVKFDDGRERGDKESETVRAKLLWQVTDNTTAMFTAERVQQEGTHPLTAPGSQPNDPQYNNVPGAIFIGSDFSSADVKNYRLNITHELENGEFKFLAGRREYTILSNLSLAPGLGQTRQNKPDNDDTSIELQYNGSFLDGDLDLTSGLFFFDETVHEDSRTALDLLVPGLVTSIDQIVVDSESRSAYVQGTYHLTDALNLTLGGRYTEDEKEAGLNEGGLGTIFDYELDENQFNYLVSLDYQLSEDTLLYASTGTGYRAGGPSLDVRPMNVGGVIQNVVDRNEAEEITNFELGFKGDFIDGRLRVNAALFLQDYENYQYVDNESVEVAPGVFSIRRVVKNTDATIEGGEIEVKAVLPTDIILGITYGYTKAEIDDSNNPNNGDALPQIPESTWSINLSKAISIGGGDLDLAADYSWRDSFVGNLDQLTTGADEALGSTVDDLGLLNLSATYSTEDWVITGFVKNATDEEYVRYTHFGAGGLLNQTFVGEPRTAGVNVSFVF